MSPLEAIAVVVSLVGVWLTIRRSMINWPVTLLACALYAVVFLRARLYSDMLLQGVFAAFAVYGWWHWQQGLRDEGAVTVQPLPRYGWTVGIVVGGLGSILLGYLMHRYTNAALPWFDSALTSFSLVAQFWSTRKHIANWPMWVAVDAVYTGVYVSKHLYLTAGLYAFLVYLAILGWRSWIATYNTQTAAAPPSVLPTGFVGG